MDFLQPPGWAKPRGYSNGVAASGRVVSVSGMIGWDERGQFQSLDLPGQVRQALVNAVAVLAEAGARPEHIVRMTWYLIDINAYKAAAKEIGQAYRDVIGRHYPAMTAVRVMGLVEELALVEIEVTAIIPDSGVICERIN